MSNLVPLLPTSGAKVEVAMYIGVGLAGVNERKHAGYYVRSDRLCNYLPLLCVYISPQYQNGQQKTTGTIIAALILVPLCSAG